MAELLDSVAEEDAERAAGLETDSTALGVALDRVRARRRKPSGDDAGDRFLAAQEALIADQRRHLREQLRTLRLDRWNKRLRLAFQALTILVGVALVATFGWMAFDAAQAEGVVIKPFTVAPDLARRGVTGEVVASQLLDKLTGISVRAQSSTKTGKFGAGWGQSLSLQIPETGVSLGEVDRWLREKLGHEQSLTGEVVQNPDGTVTLSARLNASALPPQTGAAADLPQLLLRTAEALYRREQPMAYANYLAQSAGARNDELIELGREMTDSHSPLVRSYGYAELGNADQWRHDLPAAIRDYQAAIAENAGLSWPFNNLALIAGAQGRQEEALQLDRRSLALIPNDPSFVPEAAHEAVLQNQYDIAVRLHDHATMLARDIAFSQGDNLGYIGSRGSLKLYVADDRASVHDGVRAEAEAIAFVPRSQFEARTQALILADIARARGDWAVYLTRLDAALKMPPAFTEVLADKANRTGALAHLGRTAEAHAVIDPTPLDCQPCLVARGILANAEGRWAASDHWFAEASRIGPSTPNGPLYWGEALLGRGDAAKATAQLREAVRRSPRAEDALESLGEALLAQGDVAGAVKQYAAAEKLTPRWGRAHLKWGEALAKQGKAAEAKTQFALAATLDLTASERAELAGQKV